MTITRDEKQVSANVTKVKAIFPSAGNVIKSLVLLPNGAQVTLEESADSVIKLMIDDTKNISILPGSKSHDHLHALADGRHVLSYTTDRCKNEYSIDIWDCQTKSKVAALDTPGLMTLAIASSMDSNYLIRVSLEDSSEKMLLELYDIKNIQAPMLLSTQDWQNEVDGILALPGRKNEFIMGKLGTGYERWKIQNDQLHLVEQFDQARTFRELSYVVRPTAMAATRDGQQFISGHQGGVIKIWQLGNDDMPTACQRTLEIDTGKFVNAIQMIPNSSYMVAIIENDVILFDLSNKAKIIDTVHHYMGSGLFQLNITPDLSVVSKQATISFAALQEMHLKNVLEASSKEINSLFSKLYPTFYSASSASPSIPIEDAKQQALLTAARK